MGISFKYQPDENGQMPDLSDAEVAELDREQIMICTGLYCDNLEFICHFLPTVGDDILDELANLIKKRALGESGKFYEAKLFSVADRALDKMGEEVYNAHRI